MFKYFFEQLYVKTPNYNNSQRKEKRERERETANETQTHKINSLLRLLDPPHASSYRSSTRRALLCTFALTSPFRLSGRGSLKLCQRRASVSFVRSAHRFRPSFISFFVLMFSFSISSRVPCLKSDEFWSEDRTDVKRWRRRQPSKSLRKEASSRWQFPFLFVVFFSRRSTLDSTRTISRTTLPVRWYVLFAFDEPFTRATDRHFVFAFSLCSAFFVSIVRLSERSGRWKKAKWVNFSRYGCLSV